MRGAIGALGLLCLRITDTLNGPDRGKCGKILQPKVRTAKKDLPVQSDFSDSAMIFGIVNVALELFIENLYFWLYIVIGAMEMF